MTSDDQNHQAKSDLLRELESLRAQLEDPDAAELNEDDIPLLLDKVEKVVSSTPESLADEGLDADEIEALQAAYREATTDLQKTEARLAEDAFNRLKEERDIIDEIVGDDWQHREPGPLPGQQPLFAETQQEKSPPHTTQQNRREEAEVKRPAALGENPFLPKHIRDRLQERRQMLQNDIVQAASFFPAYDGGKHPDSRREAEPRQLPRDQQALVDELVAEYLPRIEAELRTRLARRLIANPPGSSSERSD